MRPHITKKLNSSILAGLTVAMAGLAHGAVVITDAGFTDPVATTAVTTTFTQAVTKDTWIYGTSDVANIWTFPATGGNPGGYANGTFGNSTSFRKALYQVATDNKANTGIMSFSFDLNLSDGGAASANGFNVAIWGANTGDNYTMETRGTAVFNANVGGAVLLGGATYTGTTGWQRQTISNVNLGTGYDFVVIGFKSNNYDSSTDTVRIDNVALAAVPEPSSTGLIGVGLVSLLSIRRRA